MQRPALALAAALCFTSPAAFSRAFAAFVGEPPSAWRRRHAGSAGEAE